MRMDATSETANPASLVDGEMTAPEPPAADAADFGPDSPDGELADLAARGDERAFELLMNRHMPFVVSFLSGRTDSDQDTEDLCQEVFLAAFRRLDSLQFPDKFGAWTIQIARNKLKDYYRWRGHRPRIVSVGSPGDEDGCEWMNRQPARTPGPSDLAIGAEIRYCIVQAMEQLSERERAVLVPRLLGREKTASIAKRLGLRESTVRGRLLRGTKRLRKLLKRMGLEPN